LQKTIYEHGLGTHSFSELHIALNDSATAFDAIVGVDDEVKKRGSVKFQAFVDGRQVFDSGIMRGGDDPKPVRIDLKGAKRLLLIVNDGGDGIENDHADWANARLTTLATASTAPQAVSAENIPAPAIARTDNSVLSINSPDVIGVSPYKPFIFLIPATGKGPLKYGANNLPEGLTVDSSAGIISGVVNHSGTYTVRLSVTTGLAMITKELVIKAKDCKLALTPPLGWNHWNCWGGRIDAQKIKDAADWLVKSGLAAHGYQYINIDDGWEGERDANGVITSNSRFPDMKELADYVHSKSLKIGIYSGPGITTCQRLDGSLAHEEQDAKRWSDWGFDYVKYDLCSYNDMLRKKAVVPTASDYRAPYELMGKCLRKQNRDIVYGLCEYGLGEVWNWGAEIGGNSWRTTNDIVDYWGITSHIGFAQEPIASYGGPGHWTDPDMLVVGKIGVATKGRLHDSFLNQNEQVTHITLWSMLPAPLMIGCDLSQLDQFTTDLLSNDEVIAINQDSLGQPAKCVQKVGQLEVWSRKLHDGSTAVAMFNRSPFVTDMNVDFATIGINGQQKQTLRDLWQRKEIGEVREKISAKVAPHGSRLFKIAGPMIGPPKMWH
jgi:alpha-galactosidase